MIMEACIFFSISVTIFKLNIFDTLQFLLNFKICFSKLSADKLFADRTPNLLKFFNDESCGQCTPCRVGTEKAVKLLEKNIWDEKLLRELVDTMGEASICGLGQAAGNPITCSLNYFKDRL